MGAVVFWTLYKLLAFLHFKFSTVYLTQFCTVFNVIDQNGNKIRDQETISYIQEVYICPFRFKD